MKSKLPAPTAKDINEAHRLARSSAETAVQHAIRCGRMLIQVGGDQGWVERHTEVAWSTAKRYMSAARKNAQGIAFESLRHCFPSGQKTRAAAEKGDKPATAVAKNGSPTAAPVISTPKSKSEMGPPAAAAVAFSPPAPEPDDPERPDVNDEEEDAALERAEARAKEDRDRRIDKVLESSDQLAESLRQVEQQAALIGTLETTRDGYMRGKDTVTRLLQAEQRKVARLEKEISKLREENERLRERISIMDAA